MSHARVLAAADALTELGVLQRNQWVASVARRGGKVKQRFEK